MNYGSMGNFSIEREGGKEGKLGKGGKRGQGGTEERNEKLSSGWQLNFKLRTISVPLLVVGLRPN